MIFIKISKNIWRSFLRFVLMTALIHIGVLVFTAIKRGDVKFLNYFQILGLTEFWPKITRGLVSDILSAVIMVLMVIVFLVIPRARKNPSLKKIKAEA